MTRTYILLQVFVIAVFGVFGLGTATAEERFSCPVSPSVVRITVDGDTIAHGSVRQVGTGFIVSREGHVMTAFHVVKKDRPNGNVVDWEDHTITIEFLDQHGKLVSAPDRAEYVSGDPEHDVALLKLPPKIFRPVVCRAARLGENTPVQGIGWREGKNVYDPIRGFVAPGDPGDIGDRYRIQGNSQWGHSGGPIFDKGGRIIAVLTSGRTGVTHTSGETYATPIENVLSMLPATSLCRQTALRRDTSVACQAMSPEDWTTVLRMSHLHLGNHGKSVKFRELLVSANFSEQPLYTIRWGSPDKVGKFSRYMINARRLTFSEYAKAIATISDGSSIGDPGSERPRFQGVDQAFHAFSELGEEIGYLNKSGDEEVKRGDAVRILSYTARVEGIPGGIAPSNPALPQGEMVAVMIEWESSRHNPPPHADDMGMVQLYETQRALLQVTVDDSLAFNPATVSKKFFQKTAIPRDVTGSPVLESTSQKIVMDLIGLERETKVKVAWGWKDSLGP